MQRHRLTVIALLLVLAACGDKGGREVQPPASAASPPTPAAPVTDADSGEGVTVIFLGDSLTAGYGLDEDQAFPALLAEQLRDAGRELRIVNAGVSGDTTAGGLSRLDWLLRQRPDVLVVELGANDGLRGLSLDQTEENLRTIVTRAQDAGARVLLVGMLLPPNYGRDYIERFAALFPRLAAELDVPLLPFLLEDVAARPELNLPDGIHPNAEGQKLVAATVLRYLEPVLEEVEESGSASAEPVE